MRVWKYTATQEKETGYEDLVPQLAALTSPETFKALSEEEQDRIIEKAIEIIRSRNHFPVYYFTPAGVKKELKKVRTKRDVAVKDGSLVTQSPLGLLVLDFLFPNLHDVEAGNATDNSMWTRFYDDFKLSKCLRRYFANYTFSNMRTMFFMYGRFFWNTATNFAPMRAKAIFEHYCPKGGTIYDYSCGFGGRMLGALASENGYKYIGCEPNTETFAHLQELGKYCIETFGDSQYFIHNTCSEDLKLPENSVDFAFSCPPFYGLERYSTEDTQSIKRHPYYKEWLEDYVRPTIRNCRDALKDDGLYGVDIFNFTWQNKHYSLVEDWCRIAEEEGLEFVESCPIISRARKVKSSETNVEKVYIFKKK